MDALAPNPAHVPDPFAITSLEELARHYDPPRELVLRKVIHRLEPKAMAFIAASPFAVLATVGPEGVHATPRGDAPGFIRPLDDRTLALPDRRGNNRLDALRDIIANPAVALLFLVPGAGEALRVNGTARITADPALRERFAERGRLPATVVLIEMREAYLQCAKSVLRSRLWGERGRPETVPSMGEMIAAHTGGMVDPATYDREAPQRLVDTMY